jgi:hypothetical protein
MPFIYFTISILLIVALCKAKILFPVHIILRLVCLLFFCMTGNNNQAESIFSAKKLSPSKKARVIRIVLIISFFVLLWPYTFVFPSIKELAAGAITIIPVSAASNLITSFENNDNSHAKNRIFLAVRLTASDMLAFCAILLPYYMMAFVFVAISG